MNIQPVVKGEAKFVYHLIWILSPKESIFPQEMLQGKDAPGRCFYMKRKLLVGVTWKLLGNYRFSDCKGIAIMIFGAFLIKGANPINGFVSAVSRYDKRGLTQFM